MEPDQPFQLEIVSDATANLAIHLIAAVLTQFERSHFDIRPHRFINTAERVDEMLKEFHGPGHLLVHAVVEPTLKKRIADGCDQRGIPHFDLTQSLVEFLAQQSGQQPKNERSRIHRTDREYFKRIDAMEFTAQHDDSRRIESAREADIVLVGLSRVSKSPTATYLGSMGYKVANISLAREIPVPQVLNDILDKTVALTIQPKKLQEIRRKRFQEFNNEFHDEDSSNLAYSNLRDVIQEVMWAESLFREREYPMIDTTRLTVEQIAARVLEILHKSRLI